MNQNYAYVVPPPDYPGKRFNGYYAYEHHVVWWQQTGEVIEWPVTLHHKNENRVDNRLENLERLVLSEHVAKHRQRPLRHGTLSGYRRGCRCDECRQANADVCRARRTRLYGE